MNVGSVGSTQNSAAEAMETPAQTKAEAATGDQQAVQKLALKQQGIRANHAQQPAQSAPPSAAVTTNGKLDAKA